MPAHQVNRPDELAMIQSIGTYLPAWGTAASRVAGEDEDVVTMAVAAGLGAVASVDPASVCRVVLVSRDLPLLEGGNSAALLAGLGLAASTEVHEELGGAPAALEAVAAAPPGTLVIGSDDTSGAGAAAVLCGSGGPGLSLVSRISRSLPVVTRDAHGAVTDYGDPRLLRERGVGESLRQAGLAGKVAAVAGLGRREAAPLTERDPPRLPTSGASAAVFALAVVGEGGVGGRLLAVEQAAVAAVDLGRGKVDVSRHEPAPSSMPPGQRSAGPDISVSLAAYERAFDAKLRLEAARCRTCGTLSYPHRYRCLGCGSEDPAELVELPRDAEVYTTATVHVPVPGLVTPYTLVLAELGDSGVRVLVRLTGAPAGAVAIGDRGHLVFRKVAVRSGVPDYGYAFLPADRVEVRA
jgi:uncharacterized protein